jgi:signal transduction histidine kinase
MKLLPGALIVCLLLALLTFMLMKGTTSDAPDYAATLAICDDFTLTEGSLRRDVLQARAGLLRNYDPLVSSLERLHAAVARLRAKAREEGLETTAVDRLATAIAREEELTERFKSLNALLHNSLSYFGWLSTRPNFVDQNAQFAPAVGALAAAILNLTLDPSPQSSKAVEDRLAPLLSQTPGSGPPSVETEALVAHARLLRDLLPTVDDTLKALVAVPNKQPLEETRGVFADRHAGMEATAQRFRLLLYATSLLLLLALVDLGRRLRARAVALRRRAAFEHVIAENSTRLINCPPNETAARLKQVLSELGKTVGAERVYVVLAETPIRMHTWCVDAASYPPGWPEAALSVPQQLSKVGHDIVAVRDVAVLPPSDAKDTLVSFGVRSWACVLLRRPGRVSGIMGFDKFRPAWGTVFPLPVVRLAGDAVANAIERQFLERERGRLAHRLERARRMQTVGQLASGIAHNFNNIIGAIIGYSEMAEGEVGPGTRPARHINEIHRAAERGRDLIESILSFGRPRDVRSRPVPVRALLEEGASLLRALLPLGIDLVIADTPPDIALLGEPAQLQQIILNLCNNASQAMEGRGVITLAANMRHLGAPLALSHGELAPGRYVGLLVSDTGPGFGEAVARRLFEPFFTTRPAGTGLGLATVAEIVRDHEGAMNVLSTPGRGTRFEAWLPAAAEADSVMEEKEAAQTLLGRGEVVLVLENERQRLLRDEEMLAALGYEPVGFERSCDALTACRADPERFDAILISHASIPDALGLARALHAISRARTILIATTSATDVGVDALTEAGVAELLRRPLMGTELAAALSRCLGSALRM